MVQRPRLEESTVSRRQFMAATGTAALSASLAPHLFAAPTPQSAAETAVKKFYESLTDQQYSKIVFPFEHPLRSRISANWHVTSPEIGQDFYTDSQRQLIDDILRNITTPDGYERLQRQMDDDSGGVGFYSVALFGEPGKGKFEWEMTGRHLTLRADGDSVDKAAFGGPIVYGHSEEDPGQNLFHYQTKQANEVFQALDPGQRKQALLRKAPRETEVQIQGKQATFPGISVAELSDDQQQLVGETLKVLLAPFRQEDVDEAQAIIDANGGVESLNFAFYQQGDINSDKVWDIWRIEGPSMVWHFRGAPHVHAYINIGHAQASS